MIMLHTYYIIKKIYLYIKKRIDWGLRVSHAL